MDTFYCSETMLNKFNYWSKDVSHNTNELKITKVHNGIIFPLEFFDTDKNKKNSYGGVCDQNFNFIKESTLLRGQPDSFLIPQNLGTGYNPANKNIYIYIDEDVIFLGPLINFFSHFYLESLSRIWYYLEQDNTNIKLAYLTTESNSLDWNNFLIFFNLLGIKKEQLIEIKHPTQFRTVIIPEQSYILNGSYHDNYLKIINKIMGSITPEKNKKVFFSKKFNKYTFKHIGNKLSEEIFKKNGYKIFYPEQMDLISTLSILKGCEYFAAQSGSNAHNAIFCNDNINVIILNRSEHIHKVQIMISKIRNQNTTYIDTFYPHILPINLSHGPFSFAYTPYLEQYLNDNNFKYCKKRLQSETYYNFPAYVNMWANLNDGPEYQSSINFNQIDLISAIKSIKKFNFYNPPPELPSELPLWKKIIREILRPIRRVIKKCTQK